MALWRRSVLPKGEHMPAEAVFTSRAGESSGIRLALYLDVLKRVSELIAKGAADDILSFRNELTAWSPRMVEFPVWQTAYKLRSSPHSQAELIAELLNSIDAISAVLKRRAESVPTDMIGDISTDVRNYLRATA